MTAPRRGRAGARLLALVAGFAVLGALAGFVWEWWWTPAYGLVEGGTWRAEREVVTRAADGTVMYVIVAAAAGLLGGGAAALLRRKELVTLLGVLVGSAAAAGVMWAVGTTLAPADPVEAATTAADGTRLPDTLRVEGLAPFVLLPATALLTLTTAYLLFPSRTAHSPEEP